MSEELRDRHTDIQNDSVFLKASYGILSTFEQYLNNQLLFSASCLTSVGWIKTNVVIYIPIVFCPLTAYLRYTWIRYSGSVTVSKQLLTQKPTY